MSQTSAPEPKGNILKASKEDNPPTKKRQNQSPDPPESPNAQAWKDFFAFARTVDVPEDFMAERPMNVIPDRAGIFDDMIDEPAEYAPRTKPAKPKNRRSRNPRASRKPGTPGSRS